MPELPAGRATVTWSVDVACTGNVRAGWTCFATVRGEDGRPSEFEVRVTSEHLDRLGRGAAEPTDLVRRSFAFLLEREPPSSILRTFELPTIGRYFPEYEATITGSLEA